MASDGVLRQGMRAAALAYGARRLASWADVLKEDLAPGWRAALAGAATKRAEAG